MTTKQDLINLIDRLSKDYDALIAKHDRIAKTRSSILYYRITKAREQLALLDID